MTQKVSVLIPSRNEAYLTQTIKSCFDNARGDLEVVVCLEGYWPSDWKDLTAKYPNLHTVHHGEARGMRSAINSAAGSAISRGAKYLFKLDAHCMLDEGFDLKLQADMESNWIVVPRRKRLDAENWQLQDVGKPDIDYHYLSFPDDPKDFGGPGLNGKVWDQRIRERLNKPEYEIDDEMSSQGSAWFCEAAYFEQLELMDAEHWGEFWCEAQEVLMKAWLSGGRCVVNKKTWYAHLHKGKSYEGTDGKKGRGYHLPEAWLKQGRDQTMKWIWNEAWSKQTLPFEWLIDHFWPVPGWSENWREMLYKERKPSAVAHFVIGSDNVYKRDTMPVLAGNVRVLPPEAAAGSVKADDYIPPSGLQIHAANYGIGEAGDINVTERLRDLVADNSLDIRVDNSTLCPGQNPYRGKKKILTVTYSIDGGEIVTVQRWEKEILIIGKGQQQGITLYESHQGVRKPVFQAGSEVETRVCPCCEREIPLSDGMFSRHAKTVREEMDSVNPILCKGSHKKYESLEVAKEMCDQLFIEGLRPQPVPTFEHARNELAREILGRKRPMTAAALNDYLIRKFSISSYRLRAPMPIELPNFHRNDLAKLFGELGFTRGAEIGVAEGHFSEILCQSIPNLKMLYCVDPWHRYSENPQGHSKEHHEFAHSETVRRLTPYWEQVMMLEEYSMDAVRKIKEESLDFVNIDGHHSFNFVMQDLIEWSKRVRSGGVILLDDFMYLDRKRWGAGVVEAVQAYTSAHEITPWFLCQGHRSTDCFWVRP